MSKDNRRRGSLDRTSQPLSEGQLLTHSTGTLIFGMCPVIGFVGENSMVDSEGITIKLRAQNTLDCFTVLFSRLRNQEYEEIVTQENWGWDLIRGTGSRFYCLSLFPSWINSPCSSSLRSDSMATPGILTPWCP